MRIVGIGDTDKALYRYKYLPFNAGSLKMITEGTVKFTNPAEFNDPFDCLPSFELDSAESLERCRPEFRSLSTAKKERMLARLKQELESGRYVGDLHSRIGVLSLSRNPLNILMWSHYADHHRGFIVELLMETSAPGHLLDFVLPFQVTYSDERPSVTWGGRFDLERYFLTKAIQWSYEDEERVLTPSHLGPGIYKYSREYFLSSVIAGPKIRERDLQLLFHSTYGASRQLGRTIPLYRAEISRSKFSVKIPDHPNPAFRFD